MIEHMNMKVNMKEDLKENIGRSGPRGTADDIIELWGGHRPGSG